MPHDRYYLDGALEGIVTLQGEELFHLTRVMRKRKGDHIELLNGRGLLAEAEVVDLSKDAGILRILKSQVVPPLLPPLVLIQALPKLAHLEWIFQKGTELGVSQFFVFPSDRSEKDLLSPNQTRRLNQILIGAMKQCGRADLPSFEWGFPECGYPLFFGDLSSQAPALSKVATLPAALLIGPEKGWSDRERKEFESKGQAVRLAPYTLRTETAAIAALSSLVGSHL